MNRDSCVNQFIEQKLKIMHKIILMKAQVLKIETILLLYILGHKTKVSFNNRVIQTSG